MINFRELCNELLDELKYQTDWSIAEELKARASAALDEPEPKAPTLQPVPLDEQRWPKSSDFDRWGRVWCWNSRIYNWECVPPSRIDLGIHSHWLPAHALPMPSHD